MEVLPMVNTSSACQSCVLLSSIQFFFCYFFLLPTLFFPRFPFLFMMMMMRIRRIKYSFLFHTWRRMALSRLSDVSHRENLLEKEKGRERQKRNYYFWFRDMCWCYQGVLYLTIKFSYFPDYWDLLRACSSSAVCAWRTEKLQRRDDLYK